VELIMATRVAIYLVLVLAAVGLYYGLDYLPKSWRAWLAGKKTKLVGWAVIVGPELLDIATQIQGLGLIDYAPGPTQKIITQVIGVLVLVCRLRTAREQGA
jgi:hypothetical protein